MLRPAAGLAEADSEEKQELEGLYPHAFPAKQTAKLMLTLPWALHVLPGTREERKGSLRPSGLGSMYRFCVHTYMGLHSHTCTYTCVFIYSECRLPHSLSHHVFGLMRGVSGGAGARRPALIPASVSRDAERGLLGRPWGPPDHNKSSSQMCGERRAGS